MASVEFPYYFNLLTGNAAAEAVASFTTAVKLVESVPFVSSQTTVTVNAWSTSSNMNIARYSHGGTGTQSAALAVGGYNALNAVTSTEKWNLNVWSASGNSVRDRSNACGSQSAALSAGGFFEKGFATSERFNGSTWSAGPTLLFVQDVAALVGTQAAALLIGGEDDNQSAFAGTQRFNGSSWSSSHVLPGGSSELFGGGSATGTQTSVVATGYSGVSGAVFLYDGTTWSLGASVPAAEATLAGVKSAALAAGGYNSVGTNLSSAYKFNGSIWTATGSLSQARLQMAAAGSQHAALIFGGSGATYSALTEKFVVDYFSQSVSPKVHLVTSDTRTDLISEKRRILKPGEVVFFDPGYATGTANSAGASVAGQATYDDLNALSRVETLSFGGTAWVSGPSLSTPHSATSALGTHLAPLVVGGSIAFAAGGAFFTQTANCEKLVSNVWVSAGAVSEARTGIGSAGVQAAGLAFGGTRSLVIANSNSVATDAYNGTAWSSRSAMLTSGTVSGGGTQGAALAVRDYSINANEKYNGTVWSSAPRLLTNGAQPVGSVCGSQTAALVVTRTLVTEKFNGTVWALGENLIVTQVSASGSQNNAIVAGNQTSQSYTGTAWSLLSSPLIVRVNLPQAGTSGAAMTISGQSSAGVNNTHYASTEKFVGATSQSGYSRRIGTAYPVTLIQG